MVLKFGKDTSTHSPYDPQVWLEAAASDEPYKN